MRKVEETQDIRVTYIDEFYDFEAKNTNLITNLIFALLLRYWQIVYRV